MDTKTFIAEIAPMAVSDMMQSKVLASITIAQAIEESASGNHAPENNFFGIKSEDGTGQLLWTQEYLNGKWVQVQAWFKTYPDLSGCIADHSEFLTVNGRYARYGFFTACSTLDYKAAAQALQNAGYATNPSYASNLINIIESNQLYKYDQEAVNNLQAITDLQKAVKDLQDLTRGLIKTTAPDWFEAEFGKGALKDIVNDPTGDYNFWRNTACMIRYFENKRT